MKMIFFLLALKIDETKHCHSPEPATPTVAAPAPINLAAESISR